MQNFYIIEYLDFRSFNHSKISEYFGKQNYDFIIINLNLLIYLKERFFRTHIRLFYNIPILVISNYSQERTILEVNECGVTYFITIPFDFRQIPIIIQNICHNNTNINKQKIDQLLIELGIFPKLLGYKYIREAIIYLKEGETNKIYEYLSNQFYKNKMCIERDIRHAIERGLNLGNQDFWQLLFKCHYFNGEKPSNLEFLSTISEYFKCL